MADLFFVSETIYSLAAGAQNFIAIDESMPAINWLVLDDLYRYSR